MEVIGSSGQVQVAGGPLGSASGLRLTAAQLGETGPPFTAAGGSWRVLVEPEPGGAHLVIAYSLGDLNSTVARLELADALAGGAAGVLLAGLGLPLARASLAPLARIEATAAAIAGGDLSRRIDHPADHTEVGRLAEALDLMLASIEDAYPARGGREARVGDGAGARPDGGPGAREAQQRMRHFIPDPSHELRTPLTSVRGLADY